MSASLLNAVVDIAAAAGREVLAVYATDFAIRGKSDSSPVTDADQRAEALIVERLQDLTPDIPVVAEERMSAGQQAEVSDRFWLVDPLDGTKEFISRNGEFTVNIALIEHGRPVLGVVFAPAIGAAGRMFAGAVGSGAWLSDASGRQVLRCRDVPPQGSHADMDALHRFLGQRRVANLVNAGSSLKLCLVAAGEADLYPRLGTTMEWDIAAGHAVLKAAGGDVWPLEGEEPLSYGKHEFRNPHFVAASRRAR
jgi:3'(2'), 5'-bisphosphate nucleotidase